MKRILAIALSICLILVSVPAIFASAIQVSDWNTFGTVNISGDETQGFKLDGDAYATAGIVKNTDFSKQDVKFKLTMDVNDNWGYLAITKSKIDKTEAILPTTQLDGIYFLFHRTYNDVNVLLWDSTGTVSVIPKIINFDYSVEHTIGFEKISEKWYVTFDGTTYTNENGGIEVTSYVSQLVGINNHYTFAGSADYIFDKVRFSSSDWNSQGDGINITGTASEGYKILGPQHTIAEIYSDNDFSKKDVSFKFNLNALNQWVYMAITKNGIPSIGDIMPATNKMDGIYLLIQKNSETEAVILLWVGDPEGGTTGYGTTLIVTFNPEGEHSIGFEKIDNKWYLQLDGKIYNEKNGGTDLTSYLNALVDVGNYYTFTSSTDYSLESLKFVNHVAGSTGESPSVEEGWVTTGGSAATGSEAEGYKLSGPGYTTSSIYSSVDFSKKDISFTFDLKQLNQWAYIALTKNAPANTADLLPKTENLDGIYLLIEKRSDKEAIVLFWCGDSAGGGTGYGTTVLATLDPSVSNTIGFEKVDNKWYFMLNGNVYNESNGGADLSNYLNALVGVGNYYTFSGSEEYTFNNLKFVAHTSGNTSNAPAIQEGWVTTGGSTATGNDAEGYKLSGLAYTTSSIYGATDFSKRDVSFKFDLKKSNQWAYIAVTKKAPANTADLLPATENLDGIYLLIEKRSDKEAIVLFWCGDSAGGGTGYGTTVLATFDPSGEHRIGFAKENGKWYLRLDGVIYNEENGGSDLSNYLNALEGARNFYTFSGSADYTFEALKFVDSSVQPDLPPFINIGFEVGGNSKTGYSLKGELGSVAVFRNPMDVTTDTIQMKIKIDKKDQWVLLGFATSQSNHGMLFESEEEANKINALDFIITQKNDGSAEIARWNPADKVTQVVGVIKDFDWTKVHTFQFVNTLDSWYLQVDGNALYGLDLTKWVSPLVKNKTYVKLLSGSDVVEITNFKVLNPNSPGTGDDSVNIYLTAIVASLALMGAAILVFKKKIFRFN